MKYMNLQIQEVQQTQSRRNAEIHVMTHNETLEDNDKENLKSIKRETTLHI